MRFAPDRLAALLRVLAQHAAALWGLWQHRLLPAPVIEAPPMPLLAGPMALSSELAVACPERGPGLT